MNVGFSAFHEGRGAEKSTTPGGRIIVSGKRIVTGKKSCEKRIARKASGSSFSHVTVRTWSRKKRNKAPMSCPSLCSFGHRSLRDGLLWYTTKVAMESPMIIWSHQNERSVDSADDTLAALMKD